MSWEMRSDWKTKQKLDRSIQHQHDAAFYYQRAREYRVEYAMNDQFDIKQKAFRMYNAFSWRAEYHSYWARFYMGIEQ